MKNVTLCLGLILCVLGFNSKGQNYSGGSGTSGDPYKIANKADLKYLSENSGERTKHFKQTADITFNYTDFQNGGNFYNGGAGFIPIGNGSNFTGSYNGNGHTIDSLKINRSGTNYTGFFSGVSGPISNLGLTNVYVAGKFGTGGLAGRVSYTTISNCYVTGTVSGSDIETGGLAGYAYGNTTIISDCYTSATVSGTGQVGGLIGYFYSNATMSNCYTTGTISGSSNSIGGLVGYWIDGTISKCYASATVSGSNYVGGLIGRSLYNSPSNSFWNTDVIAPGMGDGPATTTGISTAQMQTQTTFTAATWDFVGETTNGSNDIWFMNAGLNNGYPVFTPKILSTGNVTICGAGTVTLNVPVVFGDAKWYDAASGGNLLHTGSTYSPSVSDTTSYWVEATNGYYTTARTEVIVTVLTMPSITSSTPASSCTAGTLTISATASAGDVKWYDAATGGNLLYTGTSYTTPSISSTTTYYAEAGNNGCVSSSRTAVVATIGGPTITSTTQATRCNPGTLTISAIASAGDVKWYDAATAGNLLYTGASFTTPSISATTTYYVEADTNGCISSSRTAVMASIASYCYSGGSGSLVDPYLIANKADLKYLSENSGEWNKHFKQIADISFNAADYASGGDFDNSGKGFIPIGNGTNAFTGSYRGGNHTIDSLKINRPATNYVAFFGKTSGSDSITWLGLTNVSITGHYYVAALVGLNNSTNLFACFSTGTVSGLEAVGGLFGGSNSGSASNCYSTCSVSGTTYVGGLLGIGTSTTTNCYSIGSVSGSISVGGLVGEHGGIITNCYSIGSVSGSNDVGGLIGLNSAGTTSNSFWNTETSGQATSADGIGKITAEMQNQSTFTNATWDFTNSWKMGGCANNGYPVFTWQNSSARPNITSSTPATRCSVGTLTISATASAGNVKWYDAATGGTLLYTGTSFTTPSISTPTTYYAEADTNGCISSSRTAVMASIASYCYSGGSGSLVDPYLIANKADLKYLSENSGEWNKHFKQIADISFNYSDYAPGGDFYNGGAGFIPIGNPTTKFFGSYRGANHTIDSLKINRPATSYVAFFGRTSGSDSITWLGLKNVSITGNSYTGALVGNNTGSINIFGCYSTGNVNGVSSVGGLMGVSNSGGSVSNSFSTVNVSASNNSAGGLMGSSHVNLTNCYATGNVNGVGSVGGLCGFLASSGSIANCYATGSVTGTSSVGGLIGYKSLSTSTLSNSFWNTQTTGQSTSAGTGATGITTAQMQNQTTFTSASWDFTNTWKMGGCANNGYPVFNWQNSSARPSITSSTPATRCGTGTLTISAVASAGDVKWYDAATGGNLIYTGASFTTPNLDTITTYYAEADTNGCVSSSRTAVIASVVPYCYAGGAGTLADPFLIATKTDLKYLSENFDEWSKHFKQIADISFNYTDYASGGDFDNSGKGFIPIGNGTTAFTGSYRGGNHTIDSLKINRPATDYVGFFGKTSGSDSITWLGLRNVSITAKIYVGALVGYNSISIYKCYSTGTINGYREVGGFTGGNKGGISNSFSAANISTTAYNAGGLTGALSSGGYLSNCYATGNVVVGSGQSGALCGYQSGGNITNCYASGLVSGSGQNGGLCGWYLTNGTISNSFWNSQTTGQSTISGGNNANNPSGATGITTAQMQNQTTFTSASWDFTNTWKMGGCANNGYPVFNWQNSSARPSITSSSPATRCGIGTLTITATASSGDVKWYDAETGGNLVYTGASFTTPNLDTITTYYAEADTNGCVSSSRTAVIASVVPYCYAGGAGTLADPFLIANKADLKYLSENSGEWTKHFKQIADISFNYTDYASGGDFDNGGEGFIPIGNQTTAFTGSYRGGNHTIDSLKINRPATDYIGFFGRISGITTDSITHLGLKNVSIIGGGLVGGLSGNVFLKNISDCHVTGSVSGTAQVGGLIGKSSSSIFNCYAAVNVNANNGDIGGLIGSANGGVISNCYATGNVSGSSASTGGLIGDAINFTNFSNCFAICSVSGNGPVGGFFGQNINGSTMSNCFWNTDVSATGIGYGSSTGATGITTAQMQNQTTFTAANWDFVGETTNGTNDIWKMGGCSNNSHPVFSWQTIPTLPDVTTTSLGMNMGAQLSGATYQWLDCNNSNAAISGATGQTYTAPGDGNYAVKITKGGCADTSVCIAVSNPAGWKSISAGDGFVVGVKKDGTLWAWGSDLYGQLGNGNFGLEYSDSLPTQIGIANDWKEVFTGAYFALALKTDSTLWAWGDNSFSQLGAGSANAQETTPVQIGTDKWINVSAGPLHSLAVNVDGKLFGWGANYAGQITAGPMSYNTPVQIGSDTDWKKAAAGSNHSLAIKTNGALYAWGDNTRGQLGDGTTNAITTPTQIGTDGWKTVSASLEFSLGIKNDGSMWAWGTNFNGELGLGTGGIANPQYELPQQIGSDTDWEKTEAHLGNYAFAIKTNNNMYGWGINMMGQLGDGTKTDRNQPVLIPGTWSTISIGNSVSAGLKTDGADYCITGQNMWGELGIGSVPMSGGPWDTTVFICNTVNCVTLPNIASSAGGSRCDAGSVNISATASAGGVKWYNAATGGTLMYIGNNFTTPTIANNTSYWAEAENAGCISSSRTQVLATVKHSTTSTDTKTACDSYTWMNGITYTASNNTAKDTLTNAAGCDSVITLNLTIKNSSSSTDMVTACDSYTWMNGITYTASNNTAKDTLTNAAGCDSVITLNLTIKNSSSSTDVITACDTYTWIDGNTYTASNNTAKDTLTNAAGCDSVVTLNLTIKNSSSSTDVITACDTYTWIDGNTYTTSNNTAKDTLTNAAGCDSIVTLNLTINTASTGTDVVTACVSYTWIDGITYTANNTTAMDTLTSSTGCDSVVTLNLTITNGSSSTGTDVITACDSYTWINGITYTSSNTTAIDTITNVSGCDSVVTLNLTIKNSSSSTDLISACDSYTWINGITYTASNNTAKDTLTNAVGCDSVITLNLTITTVDTSVIASGNTLTANVSGSTYQWVDCNNNYAPLANDTNQSFTATQSGSYAVVVSDNGCSDTSSCYNLVATSINSAGTMDNNMIVYPNPSNGIYTIRNAEKNNMYKITDINGRVVTSGKFINETTLIDLSDYENGFYILHTSGRTVKLIKNK